MRKAFGCIAAGVFFTACSATDTPTRPLVPGEALNVSQAGATLQAYKTLDICTDRSDANIWHYSGDISVWNEGAIDAAGLLITDVIQQKGNGPNFQNVYTALSNFSAGSIPAFTPEEAAISFPYSVDGGPLTGTIRNSAVLTIVNHSGGKTSGPNPKFTYAGTLPPPLCRRIDELGCALTQGYWGNKPDVVWPSPYDRTATFYLSSQTWQGVMDTPVNVSQGYYQLAHQYIAALLNQANGAFVPQGVQATIDLATAWFGVNTPAACTANGSCGDQKNWAKILDDYNNGRYIGGPPHCDDLETLPTND